MFDIDRLLKYEMLHSHNPCEFSLEEFIIDYSFKICILKEWNGMYPNS